MELKIVKTMGLQKDLEGEVLPQPVRNPRKIEKELCPSSTLMLRFATKLWGLTSSRCVLVAMSPWLIQAWKKSLNRCIRSQPRMSLFENTDENSDVKEVILGWYRRHFHPE
jgi:hypothetical protein